MILLRNLEAVNALISETKSKKFSIGFTPTMGALHQGHISLIERSVQENDFSIVTIFVNPTQFNNLEDLEKYPRTEELDINLLKNSGCDAVYFPTVEDIYPNGQVSQKYEFGGIENQMEGAFRPGHFDGVATVVSRFFEIIQPDKAYFGEKDFQQLRIIQELVKIKNLPLEIVPVAIKRETSGLAMSSRNTRLTEEFKNASPIIYQILLEAKKFIQDHTIEETKDFVLEKFNQTNLDVEYFEIADEQTLSTATNKSDYHKLRAFIAVYAGEIRLIDNISLN